MKFDKKICQKILAIFVPGMLANLVISLCGFISALLIANIGLNAVSAATLIYTIMSVLTMLVFGFLIPVTILTARAIGESQIHKVKHIFHDGVILMLIVGVIPIILMHESSILLRWAGQPFGVVHITSHYFELMAYGFYPMIFVFLINQLLIGLNKSRVSFLFVLLCSVINLILTSLFVSRYQIQGAAFSSVLSYCFILILQLIYLKKHTFFNAYQLFNLHKIGLYFKEIITLGFPIAIQRTAEYIALTILVLFMGWLGSSALSAQQVVMQMTTLFLIVPFGFMQAAHVLLSQAIAQKNLLLVKQYIFHLNILSFGLIAILVFFTTFMLDTIVSLFLNKQEVFIKHLTISLLSMSLLTILFDSVRNVTTSILRALNDSKKTMIYSFISLWFIAIPLSYMLAFVLHWGAQGIAYAWLFGVIFGTMLVLGRLSKFVRQ